MLTEKTHLPRHSASLAFAQANGLPGETEQPRKQPTLARGERPKMPGDHKARKKIEPHRGAQEAEKEATPRSQAFQRISDAPWRPRNDCGEASVNVKQEAAAEEAGSTETRKATPCEHSDAALRISSFMLHTRQKASVHSLQRPPRRKSYEGLNGEG